MPGTLINAVQTAFTDTIIEKFASLLGEHESNTRKAINAATPMVLTCITAQSRLPAGSHKNI